jgi:hypothetical protein
MELNREGGIFLPLLLPPPQPRGITSPSGIMYIPLGQQMCLLEFSPMLMCLLIFLLAHYRRPPTLLPLPLLLRHPLHLLTTLEG